MRSLQLSKSAGRFRRGLFVVAISGALILVPFIAYDVFIQRKFAILLARLDWPLSLLAPLVLLFLLADLIGELRGSMAPIEKPWTDRRHFTFVSILCYVLAWALLIFYFIAVGAMIGPVMGGQD